ncbi:MAG: monovalent cation/H+ antiporter subunit D family protein [Clostridiaceae bacterium]|nr:monovalent cation/H+ antiporter subunit D family protein [Clostridiaceae bacterium]
MSRPMDSMQFPLYILLLLVMAAVIVPILMKEFDRKSKVMILGTLAIAWGMSLYILVGVLQSGAYLYDIGNWGAKIGIQFNIDEFSAFMSFFIVSLTILIVIYSIKDIEHEIYRKQIAGYYSLVFLLLMGMLGITFTNDLFNTYVFMEILAITSCAIISIKRKKENYMAAFRYLILNTLGSLSFLFGLALLYMVTGYLNMGEVYNTISDVWQLYPRNILLALGLMLTGLGIKAAIFPLHIWLPDAHSSAPTPSSALLSSLVVKVYIFTLIKVLYRVLGEEVITGLGVSTYLGYLAAIGMIMGSVFAIGQKDIKRMLAYSSVAQIGYIILGVSLTSTQGLSAALFHVTSHGLMKTALFLSAGSIIYYKGKRDIRELNGIGYEMPITMAVFTIAALGMIGIPGTNGFMSKWYLSFAVLEAGQPFYLVVILISSFLNAMYYLPIIINAFFKQGIDNKEKEVSNSSESMFVTEEILDNKQEMNVEGLPKLMLIPMSIIASLSIILGFFPQLVMNIIELAVNTFL